MKVTTLGIDLAKSIFQLHGVDEHGKVSLQKRVTRGKLLETVAQLPPCVIGMEACASAQYWAREFQQLGHTGVCKKVGELVRCREKEISNAIPGEKC